jgi:hypothetical protein
MSEEFGIMRFKDILEELQRKFDELPTVYVCPFCNYVSRTPLPHTKETIIVWWESNWDEKVRHAERVVEFCRCPQCRTEPPYSVPAGLFWPEKFKQKVMKMTTEEYNKLVDEAERLLKEEIEHIEVTDEPTYRGWAFEDLVALYEDVAELVWIVYQRLILRSGEVKEAAKEVNE